MKHYLVLAGVAVLLAILALTAGAWLQPMLTFFSVNTDLIQGLEAAVQLLLWLGVAGVAIIGYLRGSREPSSRALEAEQLASEEPIPTPPASVAQFMTGNGVQVAGDQLIHGDLVVGNKSGNRVNTGGGMNIDSES